MSEETKTLRRDILFHIYYIILVVVLSLTLLIVGGSQAWGFINFIGWELLILGVVFVLVGIFFRHITIFLKGGEVGSVGLAILGVTYIYKFLIW